MAEYGSWEHHPGGGKSTWMRTEAERVTGKDTTRPRTLAELLAAAPSDEDRARRAAGLTERVELVRAEGWDPFRWTWSNGEVAGVALVLENGALVDEVSGSEVAALDTWAADLWGVDGGAADAEAGHPRTREWFATLRTTSG
ncbi:hypothetical protein GCM10009551_053830 [Nocardiopsis tropica]|uniref:hypothetical protein n=1 Tax=Tsukamurella strandjordii TaxID=147577 RepID=UPI0031D633BE